MFNVLVVPYEITFLTGDVQSAGTDSKVFFKAFGQKGSTSEIVVDKASDRFERANESLIKVCLVLVHLNLDNLSIANPPVGVSVPVNNN